MKRRQANVVVYLCRDFFIRRVDGGFLVNNRGCNIAKRPTLRLAKKVFRRRGVNREFIIGGNAA